MNTEKTKHQNVIGALFITSLIMFWVMIGFTGAIFLAIILSIISYKILEKKPNFQKYTTGLSVLIVIFTFVGIFATVAQQDAEFREQKQEIISGDSESHEYTTIADSYERKVELLVLEAIGTKTVINKIYSDDYLNIDYVSYGSITTVSYQTEKIMKAILPSLPTEIKNIGITSSAELTDSYGNTSIEQVSAFSFNRETWEKINWDNLLMVDLSEVADVFWSHPAIRN